MAFLLFLVVFLSFGTFAFVFFCFYFSIYLLLLCVYISQRGFTRKKTAHEGLNHGRGVKVIRRKCATRQPDVRQVRM